MFFLIGLVVVFGSVLGGYLPHGDLGVLIQPLEVLIIGGAALIGTFLGVLLAYGLVGPIASNLKMYADADSKYYHCIKAGLLAHMQGYAPAVSVEFARKILMAHERTSFTELEEALEDAPSA
jgi:chemotaxis protein MotA